MPKPKPAPAPTPRMTLEEWNAEGIRRFGENQFLWQFVCPMCGNVQSAHDFRAYKDRAKSPCDYALFGLIRIPGVIVIHPDGHEQLAFAFAEAPNV